MEVMSSGAMVARFYTEPNRGGRDGPVAGDRVQFDTLSNRLRELAFFNKGLKIVIEDQRTERSHTFPYW